MSNSDENRRSNRGWKQGKVHVYHWSRTMERVRCQVRWPWSKIMRYTRMDEQPQGQRFSES
jgi:hypothetical protein